MIEDKLAHDERLRLECLAQAVATVSGRPQPAPTQFITDRAEIFRQFVQNGTTS